MPLHQRDQLHVAPEFQPIFRELGIDAAEIFDHPQIKPWRRLADRENCTLDAKFDDERAVRFHIKRYAANTRRSATPAEVELAGQRLLVQRGIPTVELIAWGKLIDGRSFIILNDLPGYEPADKLIERGVPFDQLLHTTAHLAASLHNAQLHHRDLYLCHFFVKLQVDRVDLRLIDTARVRELCGFFQRRWIIKDLAQFLYSTWSLPINDEQRQLWLDEYANARSISVKGLFPSIERKMRWIKRHDERLRRRQPTRNISIPGAT